MAENYSPPGSTPKAKKKRDWLSFLGMAAVAGAAAFTSFSGLAGLAEMAGWNHVMAKFLPITIDAYAMTATRVWLSPANLTDEARGFARRSAVGSILASVVGNALFHAANAHVLPITWPLVIGLSAVPPITLSLITHLYHVSKKTKPEPNRSPGPAIAEPEQVQAAYPILGGTGAPGHPAAPAAKRTASAPGTVPGSAPGGATRTAPGAPGPARPGAPRLGASAPAQGRAGSGAQGGRPAQAPAMPAGPEERHRQQLAEASRLNMESITNGRGPISARALAREMRIGQDSARMLIKEILGRVPTPIVSPPEGQQANGTVRAPGQVHPQPGPHSRPSVPGQSGTGAPPTAPSAPGQTGPQASGAVGGAPAGPSPGAAGGALPAQREAPVSHANGTSTTAP